MRILGTVTTVSDQNMAPPPVTDKPKRSSAKQLKPVVCPLSSTRTMVPPEIPLNPEVLAVGWNPGDYEQKALRPFIGPSGRLLRQWLKRLNILDKVIFSNACFYRPPEGNREPTKDEVHGCDWLNDKLIEVYKPRLILCFGAPFARRYGFKGSVGSMVGKFKQEGTTTIVVLYHPAFIVRAKGTKRFADLETQTLEIIQEGLYRSSGKRQVEQYPLVKVTPIVLRSGKPTAVDTEHTGSRDPREAQLETVQAFDGSGKVLIGPSLMASRHHPLIFHYGIHDLIVLERHGMTQDHVVGDTMVAGWMLGKPSLSLKGLAWRELGASVIDYEEANAAGGEVWDNYAAQDPVLTWRLHEKFKPELRAAGMEWLYDNVEMPLQPILARCSSRGIEVDHQKIMALWGRMESRMQYLHDYMVAMIGPDFNPNSPAQVLKALEDRGFKVENTDADTLHGLPTDDFVTALLGYRKAQGRISRYCQPLSQVKSISGIFNNVDKHGNTDRPGADTGRLTQSKRNLMNLPADVKACLKAPDGYRMVYRDYSQIEVRLAAALSGDEYLLGALREGRNIHEELCISVYGYRVPELYTLSKSANFERLYGGSIGTRAEKMQVPESLLRGKEIDWPGFEAWAMEQRRQAHRTGEARTYMGRRLLLSGLDSADKATREQAERIAINLPEQGGAADIAKYAMVLGEPYMQQLKGYVAHQEHDSLMGIVPASYAQEADEALGQAMTEAVPQELRDIVDFPSKSIISTHWG